MKYQVTLNIEIDEMKAEMEYWKYNLKQTADNAQPAAQDYTKFIDLRENYEDFHEKKYSRFIRSFKRLSWS